MKKSMHYTKACNEAKKNTVDHKKAFKYLEAAHKEGDTRATLAISICYWYGVHVKKDATRAVKTLEQLLRKEENPEAMHNFAIACETGVGTKKNEKKAYGMYLRSAILGYAPSYYEVGRCLFYGLGVRKDRELGKFWIKRADQLGSKKMEQEQKDYMSHIRGKFRSK